MPDAQAKHVDLNNRGAKAGRGIIVDSSQLSAETTKDHLEEIYGLLNLNAEVWENFTKEQKDSLGSLFEYNKKLEKDKSKLQAANKFRELQAEQKRSEKIQGLANNLNGIISSDGILSKGLNNIFDKIGFSGAGDPTLMAAQAMMEVGTFITGKLDELFKDLIGKVDDVVNRFVESQEKNTYALLGTGIKLSDITDNLQESLALSQLIKQEDVYKNVGNLIQEGIVYNVEQRAFLQTMADDLGAVFDAKNGSLTRLVNLQRLDISSNRLAMERSLKELLNANYENSQYIKTSFERVSDSLLEAQSLMSAQSGIQVESIIQKWLGSMESVGMSSTTVQNLATAIGQLGSGNISALSSGGLGNLLVMGASQAGLSYSDLLTRGLTSEDTDNLMRGIVQYIASMASNSSNVVKSEYARLFGINVSDIVAATNLGESVQAGELNTNINYLLSEFGDYVPLQSKFNNLLENFIYTLGTNVADEPWSYAEYKLGRFTAQVADTLASEGGLLGDLAGWGLKKIAGVSNALAFFGPALKSAGDIFNFFMNQGQADLSTGLYGGLVGEYLSLGAGESQKIASAGSGLTGLAGVTTSASSIIKDTAGIIDKTSESQNDLIGAYETNTNEVDLMRSTMTSAMNRDAEILDIEANSYVSEQDFYQSVTSLVEDLKPFLESQQNFIKEDAIPFFNREAYETYTKIHEVQNTVTIGEVSGSTSNYISDMLSITAINTENIFMLLQEYFAKMGLEVTDYNNERSSNWLISDLTNRYADNQFIAGFNFNYQDMEAGA